ncbi:hypothetical protein, partial [Rubrivirga sp.]|uniref:hypothetical protein n=1 Tax=Rubrivirga sp. TaxID=1885344 RepID=UPI003C713291
RPAAGRHKTTGALREGRPGFYVFTSVFNLDGLEAELRPLNGGYIEVEISARPNKVGFVLEVAVSFGLHG